MAPMRCFFGSIHVGRTYLNGLPQHGFCMARLHSAHKPTYPLLRKPRGGWTLFGCEETANKKVTVKEETLSHLSTRMAPRGAHSRKYRGFT